MTLKIYHYEGCSTCKAALRDLQQRGLKFEALPIVDTPPSKAELRTMLESLGGDVRKLFNTSGQVYREMALSEKLPGMTTDEALDLLAKNGKLVKRPFVIDGRRGLVGYKQGEWETFFG